MKLIIDIPENVYNRFCNCYRFPDEVEEAIIAITDGELLEQEPCEDAISREAVLKIIDGWYEQNRDTDNIEDLIVLITYMDSVNPQEPKTEVLDKIRAEIDAARFLDKDKKLFKNANASGLEVAMDIIDKYKAEGSDKE